MTENSDLVIAETDDHRAIWKLCRDSGLDMEDGPLRNIVVAYGCFVNGEMVGCAALQEAEGNFFLEYVAVDPSHRLRGIGTLLVDKIEREAKSRGLGQLWAKARSPGFYERIGFRVTASDERTPKSLDGCIGCQQFRVTCFPEIVVKNLETRPPSESE